MPELLTVLYQAISVSVAVICHSIMCTLAPVASRCDNWSRIKSHVVYVVPAGSLPCLNENVDVQATMLAQSTLDHTFLQVRKYILSTGKLGIKKNKLTILLMFKKLHIR